MLTNRRDWLKSLGLITAGLCLPRIHTFAAALSAVPEAAAADDPIRLCFNENPYGPPESACTAMQQQIRTSNRYPWQMISALMSAIAAKNSLSADNVLLGAGSTQVIDTVVQLAAQQKGSFILARPTFGRWANAAEQAGLQKIELPLTEDKRHDLPAMLRAIKPDTRLVYICNPNNPTGTICAYDALLAFVAEATRHCLVMVDEAYLDYTDQQSLCGLVKTNKNLVVVKTFSKIYGLAGARIGYALAHPETIERLQQLQSGADIGISAVSLAAATAALQDNDFVSRSAAQNEHCRTTTIDALERAGLPCIPSHTNFIYFSLAHYKEDLFERLKQHHIQGTELFEQAGKWTRITVGTSSEMQRFIAAVQ